MIGYGGVGSVVVVSCVDVHRSRKRQPMADIEGFPLCAVMVYVDEEPSR